MKNEIKASVDFGADAPAKFLVVLTSNVVLCQMDKTLSTLLFFVFVLRFLFLFYYFSEFCLFFFFVITFVLMCNCNENHFQY